MSLLVTTGTLAVSVDQKTGRLLGVRNLARNLELIDGAPGGPAFRLELRERGWIEQATAFSYQELDGGLRLRWETADDITLIAELRPRGDDIVWTIAAENRGRATIDRLEYPVFANIGRLAGAGYDELLHSHATGMLFRDPLDLFEPDPDNRRRLRYSIYPEGFAGSTMQLLAYYGRGWGGFFIGTEDDGTAYKGYNVFRDGDRLCCTLLHKAPIAQAGASFTPDYPVVLAALLYGSWYEAADRYKRWAVQQAWCRPRERSRWLLEETGICTFGINARYDRSAWLDQFHRIAGTSVFHILGPNWVHGSQDYRNNLPRGRADWLPATFHRANIETIRRNGDRWAPFEFDLLCNHDPEFPDPVLPSRVVPNQKTLNKDAPWFPYMCAGTSYWRELHSWRDTALVRDYGCDANYYDISVSNLAMECLAEHHDHPPGAGSAIIDAFARMYRATRAATAAAKGRLVPSGTEVISECFLQEFDFYQARSEASPFAPFEVDCFRDWIRDGRAETVPLFSYVYHEQGVLRLDGWAKLAREAGELFYWTAARVLLHGGLFELNYEFSPLEDLAGLSDDPAEHYFPFAERHYAVDRRKAEFVGQLARTRVGPANPFLAYGTMLPAPAVEAEPVALDYFRYNVAPGPSYEERGTLTVPAALASAWRHGERTAWLVANLLPEQQTIRVDGKELTLAARRIELVEV